MLYNRTSHSVKGVQDAHFALGTAILEDNRRVSGAGQRIGRQIERTARMIAGLIDR